MEVTVSAHLLKITIDCRTGNNLVKEIQLKAPHLEETGKAVDCGRQKKKAFPGATGSLGVTWTELLIVFKIWGSHF